jgi:hypothetical protein
MSLSADPPDGGTALTNKSKDFIPYSVPKLKLFPAPCPHTVTSTATRYRYRLEADKQTIPQRPQPSFGKLGQITAKPCPHITAKDLPMVRRTAAPNNPKLFMTFC